MSDRFFPIKCLQMRPLMDAAELAELTRYMPSTSAMFSFSQTPYLREPTAALSDLGGTCGIVVMSCAQVGKTTIIENFLSWVVEYDRANCMIILDTQKSAERLSRGRIRPFLRSRGINNPNNTRKKDPDKSNSVVNIGLGGGANLYLCSSKSPSDLRSTPVKYLFADEVDAWVDLVGDEGDPLQNALQRMMRFRGEYSISSTPTTPDGRIYQNFLLGTQEVWGVRCGCGAFMQVKYDDIDFTKEEPSYACKECGEVYTETEIKSLPHCYQAQNPNPLKDQYGRILRSFHIPGTLAHYFYSWSYLKQLEIAALSLGESSYRSFRNTRLGECYVPKEDLEIAIPDLMRLSTSDYTHDTLPQDVAFIVMGVDTHSTCLYAQTVGYSEDLKHLYGLRYDVLVGDPNEGDVWAQLYDLFNAQYTRIDSRILRPAFIFCDSGGHRTQAVYIQSIRCKRLLPIKGMVVSNKRNADPLLGKQTKIHLNAGIKGRVVLQLLGVNAAKDQLAQMETLTIAGDKRLFFPRGNGYNVDFFKGLLSEKKIGDKWVQPRGGHTDNEPLDTLVYSMACAEYYLTKYYSRGLDREAAPQTQEGEMPRKKKNDNAETNKNPNNANPASTDNPATASTGDGNASSAQDNNNATTPQPTPSPSQRFPHM